MKNITKILVISAILMPFWAQAESSTPAPSPATVSVASVAPASTGTSASAAPASSESVVTSAPVIAPANTGSSASVAPESTGTVTSSAPAATVTSTSVGSYTPSNGGPSGSNTGGSPGPSTSGSSSSGGSYIGFYGCPMITTYMKFGANNNTIEVTKLQNFLKNIEKLDVDVNGIFDRKTEKAVIAFQNKYSSTIMGPWSTNQGTGFVYITTQKQINKIACNLPLTLNANELAIINNAKAVKSATKSVSKTEVIMTPKNEAEVIMTEVKINETQAISTSTDSNKDQTASVSKPSIMKRFVNFIIYLFK